MSTLLDLLLLLVIGKEAIGLSSYLPMNLWAVFVFGLPFMLGMAHSMRENRSSIVVEPIRALIGEGLTVVTFTLSLVLLTYQGLAPAFWTLFVVMLLLYVLGRVVGMTASALLLLVAIGISFYIFAPSFSRIL